MNKLSKTMTFAALLAGGVCLLGSASAFADCTPASIDPSCSLSILSPANPQSPANVAQQQAQQQFYEQQQQQAYAYQQLTPEQKCERAKMDLLCTLGIACTQPPGMDCGRRRKGT